jgi:hypothetical protein
LHLGHRERWGHIDAAMVRAAQSGIIVVVQVAERHSVQECGLLAGNFRADSNDSRLGISALQCDNLLGHTDRRSIYSAEGAPQRIEKHSLGFLDNLWRQVCIPKLRHPAPDIFRHARPAFATVAASFDLKFLRFGLESRRSPSWQGESQGS